MGLLFANPPLLQVYPEDPIRRLDLPAASPSARKNNAGRGNGCSDV